VLRSQAYTVLFAMSFLTPVVNLTRKATFGFAQRHVSVKSILHGSPEAKQAGDVDIQHHSKLIARGKYVHGFEVHRVKPETTEKYIEAAEEYYTGLKEDTDLHVKLTGNWQVVVGEQDTFYHILEYENYNGYDRTTAMLRGSKHEKAYKKMLPYLILRSSQLNQEFAFFPHCSPSCAGWYF